MDQTIDSWRRNLSEQPAEIFTSGPIPELTGASLKSFFYFRLDSTLMDYMEIVVLLKLNISLEEDGLPLSDQSEILFCKL